jgi:hypothetical protein
VIVMTNRLQESVLRDPELGDKAWNEMLQRAEQDRIIRKAIREGLFSDVASALGAMHDRVWAGARSATIGRELLTVIPTKQALERFVREGTAYVFESGEAPPMKVASRVDTVDVRTNVELSTGQEWSEAFAEDASFDVVQYYMDVIGYGLARKETEKVIALYNAISGSDLANGSESTIATPISWANITDNLGYVESQDFHPNVVAVSPTVYAELMRIDQFVNSLYLDPANIKQGVIQHTTLGVTFIRSSLITKTLFIDTTKAGVMLVRREPLLKTYERPDAGKYGVVGSERIGLAVLRTKAVQRGSR